MAGSVAVDFSFFQAVTKAEGNKKTCYHCVWNRLDLYVTTELIDKETNALMSFTFSLLAEDSCGQSYKILSEDA